jgi:hypothetical protein
VAVSPREYGSWGDVYDSDHRPVYASLDISLPVTDYPARRAAAADALRRHAPPQLAAAAPADLSLAPDAVRLHPERAPEQTIVLANEGAAPARFHIVPDCVSAEAAAAVEVRPVSGLIAPGEEASIRVRAAPDAGGDAVVAHAAGPRYLRLRVLAGPEFGDGGDAGDPRRRELEFHAVVLPEFAPQDTF